MLDKLDAQIKLWRKGASVRRYHTLHTTVVDTVGAHSGGVAYLCALLAGPECSAALLKAALYHDLPEYVVGDVPSPIKVSMNGALDKLEAEVLAAHHVEEPVLTEKEVQLLKFCDAADGTLFCIEELRRGNRDIKDIAEKYLQYLGERSKILKIVYPLTTHVVVLLNKQFVEVYT